MLIVFFPTALLKHCSTYSTPMSSALYLSLSASCLCWRRRASERSSPSALFSDPSVLPTTPAPLLLITSPRPLSTCTLRSFLKISRLRNSPSWQFTLDGLQPTCKYKRPMLVRDSVILCEQGLKKNSFRGGSSAPLKAPESISGMLQVFDKATAEDTGSFKDYSGKTLPW